MYYLKNFKNMTKRFIFSVAAIAIMLVSCSQNDMEVTNIPTSDAITLSPSTAVTRAGITDFNTLADLNGGFRVFATTGTNPTDWYADHATPSVSIDGNNKHVYDGSKWNFNTPVMWPEKGNYPIDFYAFFPINHSAMPLLGTTTTSNLKLDVTIPTQVSQQIDIVSAHGQATTKPATASLSLNFDHILSKVNFAVTNTRPGNDPDDIAYVQAVGFKDVNQKNVFDVIDQVWNVNGANKLEIFNYYQTFIEGGTGGTNLLDETEFKLDNVRENFYTTSTNPTLANANMMLLPQVPANLWKVTKGVNSTPNDGQAHVRVMYRYELSDDVDYIGFRDASTHPEYATSSLKDRVPAYTGHLYVLAGFTYEGTWVEGKGYLYNIPLPGTGGGRLLDEYLYDEYGNRTDLKYPGGEEGEPVITEDEYIHLIPIVTKWDEQLPENVDY